MFFFFQRSDSQRWWCHKRTHRGTLSGTHSMSKCMMVLDLLWHSSHCWSLTYPRRKVKILVQPFKHPLCLWLSCCYLYFNTPIIYWVAYFSECVLKSSKAQWLLRYEIKTGVWLRHIFWTSTMVITVYAQYIQIFCHELVVGFNVWDALLCMWYNVFSIYSTKGEKKLCFCLKMNSQVTK